ncbi:APC family permease [Nocardioides sp. GY 10113]|uniref:APC family permease n=1 Tax=Nocardioides sp. GY 10113 TaxID=2569761 RepID=UPI001458BC2B|nr:APC family permease [Nocardioides sp. GY 10113]
MSAPETSKGLASGSLGVWAIVFFVMSAAAPLTVVASGAPLTVYLAGIGGPGAMLAAGVVLMLFASGFTAMTRYVRDAGAFYAYTTEGLGAPVGSGAAALTTYGYTALLLGFYGFVAFFAQMTAADLFGIDLPWIVWAVLIAAFIGFLGYRQVDMGAKVLAVLLTAEVALLAVLSLAVLIQGSPEPLTLAPFDPSNWLTAEGAGGLFVLGFGAYIGFEGTAIYAEEARNPERTIPRATYIAIGFLGVFYAFTFYCFIAAFGMDGVVAAAQGDFESLPFVWADEYLGTLALKVLQVLIVTSFVACLIAFHNACSRYLFSQGRSGLLPAVLGKAHPKHHSPYVGSLALTALSVAALLLTQVVGWDPYLDLGLLAYGTGVVSIVAAQALCAIAVLAFFGRDRRGHSPLRVVVAPVLAVAGLVTGLYLILTNFVVVTGYTGTVNTVLMLLPAVAFASGVAWYAIRRPGSVAAAAEARAHEEDTVA